jgi:diaminopimelate epimerase
VKASACGNDFLLIDASVVNPDADFAALTRQICDRHWGVGADGVEWMYPHPSADVGIHLLNADGSSAEISGNGTRCTAAFISASHEKETVVIQTGAGLKTCKLIARHESEYEFEIEMGHAAVEAELAVEIAAIKILGIPLSIGNPHYVILVPEFPENWQGAAAEIQRSAQFPQGVNVELVVIDGRHDMQTRFFERGVGETQSSGTGSCAAAVAGISTGRVESPVRVLAPGGTQTVRQEGDNVFLRGTARLVCEGEYFLT